MNANSPCPLPVVSNTAASMLHYTMEAHFDAKLAYEVEPVVEDEDGGEVPRKKAKKS